MAGLSGFAMGSFKVLRKWFICLRFILVILHELDDQVLETSFDVIFFLEFIFRIFSAPSKYMYFTDPVNWADVICVVGLPLRASIGFVFNKPPASDAEEVIQVMLIFFLPLFRFLKLIRYFEITRLLIEACARSAEAVPVLSYIMALIVLVSATFIYLFEDKSNISSMPHALWLAVVTMTTVGYGDYYPTSLGGYLTVAVLTFISVVFLAIPVGIIGHEFNKSWQSRAHMLLMTRVPWRKKGNEWQPITPKYNLLVTFKDLQRLSTAQGASIKLYKGHSTRSPSSYIVGYKRARDS